MEQPPPRPSTRPSRRSKSEEAASPQEFDFDSSETPKQPKQPEQPPSTAEKPTIPPKRPMKRPPKPANVSELQNRFTIQPADPEAPQFRAKSDLQQRLESLDTPNAASNPEAVALYEETAKKLDAEGPGGPTAQSLHYPALGLQPPVASDAATQVSAPPKVPTTRPRRFKSHENKDTSEDSKDVNKDCKDCEKDCSEDCVNDCSEQGKDCDCASKEVPEKNIPSKTIPSKTEKNVTSVLKDEPIDPLAPAKNAPVEEPKPRSRTPSLKLEETSGDSSVPPLQAEEDVFDIKAEIDANPKVKELIEEEYEEPPATGDSPLSKSSSREIEAPIKKETVEKPGKDIIAEQDDAFKRETEESKPVGEDLLKEEPVAEEPVREEVEAEMEGPSPERHGDVSGDKEDAIAKFEKVESDLKQEESRRGSSTSIKKVPNDETRPEQESLAKSSVPKEKSETDHLEAEKPTKSLDAEKVTKSPDAEKPTKSSEAEKATKPLEAEIPKEITDAPKPKEITDANKPESVKSESVKPENVTESVKPESDKLESVKSEDVKPENVTENVKPESDKPESVKSDSDKAESVKPESDKAEGEIDPHDTNRPLPPPKPAKRPEKKPLAPKPKGALAARFEAALREHETTKEKPVPRPKPKPRLDSGTGASSRFGAMFADLNAASARPPPGGRPRFGSNSSQGSEEERKSSIASEESTESSTPAKKEDQSVDTNETADAQLSAMPRNLRARTKGPGGKRRLPSTARPSFVIVAPPEPVWQLIGEMEKKVDPISNSEHIEDSELVDLPRKEEGAERVQKQKIERSLFKNSDLLAQHADHEQLVKYRENDMKARLEHEEKEMRSNSPKSQEASVSNSDTLEDSKGMGAKTELDLHEAVRRSLDPEYASQVKKGEVGDDPTDNDCPGDDDKKSEDKKSEDPRDKEDPDDNSDIPTSSALLDKAPDSTFDMDDEQITTRPRLSIEDLSKESEPVPESSTTPSLGVNLRKYLDKSPQTEGVETNNDGSDGEYFSLPVRRRPAENNSSTEEE